MQRRIDAELLRNIMRLYTDVDKGEQIEGPPDSSSRSLTGMITSTAAFLLSLLDRVGPELKKIVELVLKHIKDENTPEEWVNVVILLGNQAAEAERIHKSQWWYDKTKQSRLCDILLLMRNRLLMELTEVKDDYKDAVDAEMQRLEAAIADKTEKIARRMGPILGLGVNQNEVENDQMKRNLAYLTYNLSDAMNIHVAEKCGLNYLLTVDQKNKYLKKWFKKVSCLSPKFVHEQLPYALQNYRQPGRPLYGAETMFDDLYSGRLRMSWERFVQIHGDFDFKGKNRAAPKNGTILEKADPIELNDDYLKDDDDVVQKDVVKKPVVLIKTKEVVKDKPKVSPPAPKNKGGQHEKMEKHKPLKKVVEEDSDSSEESEEPAPRVVRRK